MKCKQCQVLKKECKKCYDRRRYINNRENIIKRNRLWIKSHKDKAKHYCAVWRKNNQSWIKNWHKNNRRKINKYWRERRRKEPILRINASISRCVNYSLNSKKAGLRWESLVGYTIEDLMKHLEAKFKDGMSWENYGRGGWHIDHIIPKSMFSIVDKNSDDFKKCWDLSNLQPLWESDNCSKGNKFIG